MYFLTLTHAHAHYATSSIQNATSPALRQIGMTDRVH
jgi:hypothetical protein